MTGDPLVTSIAPADILRMKAQMLARDNSVSRQIVILAATKRFLGYCQQQLNLPVVDPDVISLPKRPRREVTYLTAEEVERFVAVIPLITEHGTTHSPGIRFRALVEALLGSAMRIGELLSLNRADVDFEHREARVIGKGNKQRTVFFTERALYWLSQYLKIRRDDAAPLFISQHGTSRLSRTDIWRPFARYRRLAGLTKPVRPHLLRHTAATQLLFNGCPIGHIKEILGHERLETTCRYYLGLDLRAAKLAHETYLVYGNPVESAVPTDLHPAVSSHGSGCD
jgi:site-specific recombinase XerD